MFTCSFFYPLKKQFFTLLFVLLFLCGCGSSTLPTQTSISPNPTPSPTPTLSSTPTPSPTLTPSPTPNPTSSGQSSLAKSVNFNLDGILNIYSPDGFTCSIPSPMGTPYNLTPGLLVLPAIQPTYDQATLQSLGDYLNNVHQAFNGINVRDANTGSLNGPPYPAFSANPNAFQLVPSTFSNSTTGCNEVLHITNIGDTPVQISQVSVQLMANTTINNQHYNLINICSIPPSSPNCAPLPSGGGEEKYMAQFALRAGKANIVIPAAFWGKPMIGPGQPPLTLQKGEVAQVDIVYLSQSNLSFSLMPSFTLDWSGKQTTYPISQLQETFAFASASQSTCYSLQGQRFIESSSGSMGSGGGWCI